MKMLSLCLIASLGISFSAHAKFQTKIIGGTNALQGEMPFMVSLQSNKLDWNGDKIGHFCGGSLIAKNWVLTAAHCVYDDGSGVNADEVWIGMYDQTDTTAVEKFKVLKSYVHPKYNPQAANGQDYDYALVKLAQSTSRAPIALNSKEIAIGSSQIMAITAGWGNTSTGWGYVSPDILQKVSVPLVSTKTCNLPVSYNGKVTDRMICAGYKAGGKDSCQGDSGGPLMVQVNGKFSLIGIVSWGAGCAAKDKYGVYSKVNVELPWIKSTAGL